MKRTLDVLRVGQAVFSDSRSLHEKGGRLLLGSSKSRGGYDLHYMTCLWRFGSTISLVPASSKCREGRVQIQQQDKIGHEGWIQTPTYLIPNELWRIEEEDLLTCIGQDLSFTPTSGTGAVYRNLVRYGAVARLRGEVVRAFGPDHDGGQEFSILPLGKPLPGQSGAWPLSAA